MSVRGWPACAAALMLTGCLTRTAIGSLPGDAGTEADADVDAAPDPLAEFQAGMRGRFCGVSVFDVGIGGRETPIEIEFGVATYTVRCNCSQPFQNSPMPDNGTGYYKVTELSLDEQGWGRAQDPSTFGFSSMVQLDHIRLDGDRLTMQRIPSGDRFSTLVPPVTLELTRCGDDCDCPLVDGN